MLSAVATEALGTRLGYCYDGTLHWLFHSYLSGTGRWQVGVSAPSADTAYMCTRKGEHTDGYNSGGQVASPCTVCRAGPLPVTRAPLRNRPLCVEHEDMVW